MIDIILSSLPAAGVLGAAGGGGFYMVRWLLEFVVGRIDKREKALDDGWDDYRERLETRCAALEARVAELEHEVRECRLRELEWQARAMKLDAVLAGLGEGNGIRQRDMSGAYLEGRADGAKAKG